ncbi:MAG TPA: hypothetical protein DCS93_28685 [Microscillaceae bacterium]|nr:hypothetical protein [Microscillaceae bacterium]
MKKLKNLFFICAIFSLTSFISAHKANEATTQANYFKIVNDTNQKVYVYVENVGGGTISGIFKGSSGTFRCIPGKKVYTASRGLKDRFLFKITSSMCDTKVKLSDYL